jgi:hypothetical protein
MGGLSRVDFRSRGESVAPAAFSDLVAAVADILG